MCKTFNDVPLSLTCPSGFNLTQTNNFTVKSVEGIFHSLDSLTACRCNCFLQNIFNSACWQLNYTALTLSRLFKNNWTKCHRFGDHLVGRNFQRRRTVVSGVDDQWQTDLIDLPNAKMFNDGHKFVLIVLEKFSLYELSRWRTKQASLFSKPLQKF